MTMIAVTTTKEKRGVVQVQRVELDLKPGETLQSATTRAKWLAEKRAREAQKTVRHSLIRTK